MFPWTRHPRLCYVCHKEITESQSYVKDNDGRRHSGCKPVQHTAEPKEIEQDKVTGTE